MHADGAGLYLVVEPTGRERWSYIFQWERRRREMGLGSLADVSLVEARELATAARKQVRAGQDPIAERRRRSTAAKTFGDMADELLVELEPGWKHPARTASSGGCT